MVQAFIESRGVTVCPGYGTKELVALNVARQAEYAARDKTQWGRRGGK